MEVEDINATEFVGANTNVEAGEERKETRGRKKKVPASEDVRAMDLAVQRQHENAKTVAEIDRAYLPEGESYNLHVVIERTKFYQAQAAESLIEMGKQIILLKAHEPHGQFLTALEKLDISQRAAYYAMQAAEKFGNLHTCANLGNAKIRALTVLDDDSIKTLEDGGEVKGVGTLDDVERMTVRELRSALRAEKKKRKEEREAQEAAISQKEKKLNELEAELRYREPPTKEQLAQAALDDMKKDLFKQIGVVSYELERLEELIQKAQKVEGVTVGQLDDWLVFEKPENFLASIFDIAEELKEMTENIRPARAKQVAAEAE